MVRCASLCSQLVGLFSRRRFYELVGEHHAERYAKGYSSWDHFVARLFCQLAQAKSLREICGGLDVTDIYNRYVGAATGHIGFLLKANDTNARYSLFARAIALHHNPLPITGLAKRVTPEVGFSKMLPLGEDLSFEFWLEKMEGSDQEGFSFDVLGMMAAGVWELLANVSGSGSGAEAGWTKASIDIPREMRAVNTPYGWQNEVQL